MTSPDPVLHLVVGPNGAGKSTLVQRVIEPATCLPFINTDVIAAQRWPDDPAAHAYQAAAVADQQRLAKLAARESFIAETVRHSSKLDLVAAAARLGYHVTVHVVAVPEELAVARVRDRVRHGGHAVPEDKTRGRYRRLWRLASQACVLAEHAYVYDNSRADTPFRVVATFDNGRPVTSDWPGWTPDELTALG